MIVLHYFLMFVNQIIALVSLTVQKPTKVVCFTCVHTNSTNARSKLLYALFLKRCLIDFLQILHE